MFDLSKSLRQLCIAINGEKIDFFGLHKHLKMVRERKKTKKTGQNLYPFLSCEIKL